MALFVALHQHAAETCPAGDPQMGPMLLQHISRANATNMGVNIHGEAVEQGGHRLFLIVDAQDQETVDKFMAPFGMVGSVEVLAASPCEEVVARKAC
jgi:uncharacterized protein with GYD domain